MDRVQFDIDEGEINKVLSNMQRLILAQYSIDRSGKEPKLFIYRNKHFVVIERQGLNWYMIGKVRTGAPRDGKIPEAKTPIDNPEEWILNGLKKGYILCDNKFKSVLDYNWDDE